MANTFERLMRKLGYVKVDRAQENYVLAARKFADDYTTGWRVRAHISECLSQGRLITLGEADNEVWVEGELIFAQAVRLMQPHAPVEQVPYLIVKEYGKPINIEELKGGNNG